MSLVSSKRKVIVSGRCVCVCMRVRVCVCVCVCVWMCLNNTRTMFIMHDLELKSLEKSSNGN